jgi:hypothetical protein
MQLFSFVISFISCPVSYLERISTRSSDHMPRIRRGTCSHQCALRVRRHPFPSQISTYTILRIPFSSYSEIVLACVAATAATFFSGSFVTFCCLMIPLLDGLSSFERRSLGFLCLHQWEMACGLLVAHDEEANDDRDPVDVVRDNGTVCCRVLPSEDCVEDTPSSTTIEFRVAEVDVPDALSDVVGSCTGSSLSSITSGYVVPVLGFKVPDGSGEETGGDEVEETGGDDEEVLELG